MQGNAYRLSSTICKFIRASFKNQQVQKHLYSPRHENRCAKTEKEFSIKDFVVLQVISSHSPRRSALTMTLTLTMPYMVSLAYVKEGTYVSYGDIVWHILLVNYSSLISPTVSPVCGKINPRRSIKSCREWGQCIFISAYFHGWFTLVLQKPYQKCI